MLRAMLAALLLIPLGCSPNPGTDETQTRVTQGQPTGHGPADSGGCGQPLDGGGVPLDGGGAPLDGGIAFDGGAGPGADLGPGAPLDLGPGAPLDLGGTTH